jgi:outer membrane protein assembly factor BamB
VSGLACVRLALSAVAVAGVLFVTPGGGGRAAAQASDDAPWPMAGRDAAHSGTAEGPAPPYRQAWRQDVGLGGPVAGPVVGAEAVVVVAARGVVALDPETGETLWSAPRSEGPAGSPAIAGDLVVHASGSGSSAAVVARGLEDGRERWRGYLGSPADGGVVTGGGVAYVGTGEGILLGFDLASGEPVFRFASRGAVRGTPALAGGVILAGWEGRPAGSATIRAISVGSGLEERSPEWQVAASPASLPAATIGIADETAFAALGDGTVRAVGLESGQERWQERLRNLPSNDQLLAAGAGLLVADRFHLARLDPTTGEEQWAYRLADLRSLGGGRFNTLSRSAPTAVGDAVLVGDAAGLLSAVDLGTGHRVWRADLGRGAVSAPAADAQQVYVTTLGREGEAVALEHNPDARPLDEVSPTVLFPLRAVLNFVLASVLAAVVLLGVFRYGLRGRASSRTGGAEA